MNMAAASASRRRWKFDVSLFECNLGLSWPAEVTITSNWRVNYPQDKELDWNRDFGFPLIH